MQEYPLAWPDGVPRTEKRTAGAFKTTLTGALNNVRAELRRFAKDSGKTVTSMVISSNVTLAGTRPQDPGIAVWFTWDELNLCIAVDRYSSVEANLQAVFHVLEARRTELRHGGLHITRTAFMGFRAKMLTGPKVEKGRPWEAVLGLAGRLSGTITSDDIEAAFKRRRSTCHPDKPGGSDEKWHELTTAYEEAKHWRAVA